MTKKKSYMNQETSNKYSKKYHNKNAKKTRSHLYVENKTPKIQKENKLEKQAYWEGVLKAHSKQYSQKNKHKSKEDYEVAVAFRWFFDN
jgi:hypothetical protein